MFTNLICRIVILIFGVMHPAYKSYKSLRSKSGKEPISWLMYWIVFAFFTSIEAFTDVFLAWIPFYHEIKIVFLLWLVSPFTRGYSLIYRRIIHPELTRREQEIDLVIEKASEKGYAAILEFGAKGINYAANTVLTTAYRSSSLFQDQLRRSYSLNDMRAITDGGDDTTRCNDEGGERKRGRDEPDQGVRLRHGPSAASPPNSPSSHSRDGRPFGRTQSAQINSPAFSSSTFPRKAMRGMTERGISRPPKFFEEEDDAEMQFSSSSLSRPPLPPAQQRQQNNNRGGGIAQK